MVDAATKSDVLRANDTFYDAVRASDFDALDALWSQTRPVGVFHPGWSELHGREDVMASWAEIFVTGNAPDIWPVDELIVMSDQTAIVFCSEILGSVRLSATNTFVREGGHWRMTQHMALG